MGGAITLWVTTTSCWSSISTPITRWVTTMATTTHTGRLRFLGSSLKSRASTPGTVGSRKWRRPILKCLNVGSRTDACLGENFQVCRETPCQVAQRKTGYAPSTQPQGAHTPPRINNLNVRSQWVLYAHLAPN